ncbi:MAG: SDR family NAD(P)-dependent oxidoreductase [Oscillospiraceae bacterium]|nr:SDR family NAD(P)-dependent oxidoreductase [Oscillospiraceae bacterium]
MYLRELVGMSRLYGSDPDYVLGGGGNTSVKADGTLYVKASGTSLGAAEEGQFAAMDLGALTAILERAYPGGEEDREAAAFADILAARLPGQGHKRPSVETILHAVFPFRFVLHVHPALVNGLSCGQDGAALCGAVLGEGVVWIPLTKPGYVLAAACKKAMADFRAANGADAQVFVLQNHGIFIAADTAEEIGVLMDKVMGALKNAIKTHPDFSPVIFDRGLACVIAPALRMLYSPDGNAAAVFHANRELCAFSGSKDAMKDLMGPFTPDHIVYCKAAPLFITSGEDYAKAFEDFTAEHGYKPKVVAVQGLGFFTLGDTKKDADLAGALLRDAVKIAVYSRSFGGARPLPKDMTRFILGWEAEGYRRKALLGDGSADKKRLSGKIAVVTGGAQGLGRDIAKKLAENGAYTVAADRNESGAAQSAECIRREFGEGAAASIACDVTDESSVKAMIESCVLAYGGLDIFVSCAGVAGAGGLDEMSRETFEFISSVNYTGYFLCAKYASAVMKIQREYSAGYMSDIIEINSKSGLSGSEKNFAYAGSKFAGIGLTQSFALELAPYGIKVNAVCPGNLLDGAMWSDPQNGLLVQFLKVGKVPGAKTAADVRRFYESKVPMKRGCTSDDVFCAVLYVIEQKYETGQAVPVTGGQIMLR